MKRRLLLIIPVILGFSVIAAGRNFENRQLSRSSLPERAMREVVRRILVYKFKPAKRQRAVYLLREGIDPSWLPAIRNVEFRLLSDKEMQDREEGVYFFTKPDLANGAYQINFAFGKPECYHIGNGWRFRVSKNRVRLWLADGFGSGCSMAGGEFKTPRKYLNRVNRKTAGTAINIQKSFY